MGLIEEKRRIIMREMDAGRGSEKISLQPVSLEPPFMPFNLHVRKPSFFEILFGRVSDRGQTTWGKAEERSSLLGYIRIKPSREGKNTLDTAEQLLLSLPAEHPVAFEIVGYDGRIRFQLSVSENLLSQTVSQLRTHLPDADITIDEDILSPALSPQSVARAYRLKSSSFLTLSPVTDSSLDTLHTLFGFLGDMERGRTGILQVLFKTVVCDWPDNMRNASRNPYDPSQSPFVDLPSLPKIVDKKLSKPLFAVSIRMVATDEDLLSAMELLLRQFDDGLTGLLAIPGAYPVNSIRARNTFVHGSILNLTELASFVHLPAPDILNSMHAVEQAMKSYPVPEEYLSGGPIIGINTHRGTKKFVCHGRHLPNQHSYEAGKSGYGKSSLILMVAIQRIAQGDGVAVIDPHGALIRDGILPRIPKERIDDIVYFNAGDFEYPMAINPLAHKGTKIEKEHIRVDLLNFFEDLFETPLGVNIQHALNFFIITLLTYKDSTLSDIERLMIDRKWREKVLEDIDDERIHSFWAHEYPLLEKRGIVAAIMNKLSPLILPGSTIGSMLTSRDNKVDFLDVMNNRKVLLGVLSHGDIGKRNSQLLGKLLVSKLQIAAMMREGEGRNPDFYCFIDEFQHMVCPSMADILSGARKYGLHLWLANQMIGDIPDYIMRHVFNASTLIFFATDSPSDQLFAEKTLSRRFKSEEFGRLKKGETYVKMVGSVFNMSTELVPERPPVQWMNEIIALSRARYTISRDSSRTGTEKRHKATHLQSPRESVRAELKGSSGSAATASSLSAHERSFLQCIFQNPTLSITGVYRNQKLSAYMGDKVKNSLKEKGFVHEMTTHLGSGSRIAKFLILTSQGFSALKIDFGSGKGSTQHRYWQSIVSLHAENAGYKVVIEEPIPGSRETVDLGLQRNGEKIAVEVSITTKAEQEIGNITKCLKAGYDQVISLYLHEGKMDELKDLAKNSFTELEQSKIKIGLVYDFCSFCK